MFGLFRRSPEATATPSAAAPVPAPGPLPVAAKALPNFGRFLAGYQAFGAEMDAYKAAQTVDFTWYPYNTLANVEHLRPLVTAETDHLFAPGRHLADIGAADGLFSFFAERLGLPCDIYDNGPTNMNGLRAARRIAHDLQSKVRIFEVDLDAQFTLTEDRYDVVFFLGILYHLKNPFFALERLSYATDHLFVSTRVVRHFRAGGPDLSDNAAAYLVSPVETNNDSTNYWMFTNAGLKRIFERTGWEIVGYRTVGDVTASNPQDSDHDERAFALLRSLRPKG